MNQFVKRMTGSALVVAVAALLFATPCAADAVSRPAAPSSLSALSPASLQILRTAPAATRTQEGPASTPGAFFKSRRGAVTLGLIAAGVGFTVWSINHDRKPVKSPIR
ncbi:MAG: hypothetical protein ACRD1S_19415 [Vicinamibacterales bacterium]